MLVQPVGRVSVFLGSAVWPCPASASRPEGFLRLRPGLSRQGCCRRKSPVPVPPLAQALAELPGAAAVDHAPCS